MRRTIAMKHLRERVNVRRTSELEMAEEAALRAVEKIFGCMSGQSSDFKGAPTAQKTMNAAGIPLSNQQNTAARARARRRPAHPAGVEGSTARD
jgi:hypothetical protein